MSGTRQTDWPDPGHRALLDQKAGEGVSRDRVVASIYEAVLRPQLYGDFMDLWSEHVLFELTRAHDADSARAPATDGSLLGAPELEDHFRRAFDILERIGRERPAPDVARFVQDHLGLAMLVRADGSLAAQSFVARRHGLESLADLEEHLSAGSAAQLRMLLSEAVRDGTAAEADTLVLSTDLDMRYLIARVHADAGKDADAQVLIEPLEVNWSDRAETLLARSFGLSPAELDLVRNLMSGRSLRQIAEETNRSEHTVRNQSKSVLAKTGSPSQADLIRLVAVLCRDLDESNGLGAQVGFGGRRRRLRSADGLDFDTFEFGSANGQPVLFLHGMLESLAVLSLIAPELQRRGLRVIAPIRAGYGHSAPMARSEKAFDMSLAQADAIWAEEDLGPVVVIGHMAGGMHAFCLASRRPDKVSGVISVAGGMPHRSLSQFRSMAPRQRIVAYTARLAPMLLPTILRAGIAQIDSHMVTDFATALYAEGSCDYRTMQRRGLRDLLCEAYRFSVLQGHMGFLGDAYFAVRDWGDYMRDLSCPVRFIHGAEDPAIPTDTLPPFVNDIPGAELTVLPETGQLVFYDRPDLVLDAVEALTEAAGAAA